MYIGMMSYRIKLILPIVKGVDTVNTNNVKILVCGELGIDAPFLVPNESLCREHRAEQRKAFSDIINFVRSRGVDIAVFCGKLFESARLSERSARMICDAFASARGCRFVLLPSADCLGEVKSLYETNRFTDNVYVAGRKGKEKFDFDDIGVCVRCRVDRTSPSSAMLDQNKLNILCSDGLITEPNASTSAYDIIAMSDPQDGGRGLLGATDCIRVGPAVSVGFDSLVSCRGGIYYIEAEKTGAFSKFSCERIEIEGRVYSTLCVAVDGCASEAAAVRRVRDAVYDAALPAGAVLRLVISGATEIPLELEDSLELPRVHALFVENTSLPTADERYLSRDMTARGMLYRSFLPLMRSPETSSVASDAYRIGMAALCFDPSEDSDE